MAASSSFSSPRTRATGALQTPISLNYYYAFYHDSNHFYHYYFYFYFCCYLFERTH